MKKLVLSAIAATALLTAVGVTAVISPQSALADPSCHMSIEVWEKFMGTTNPAFNLVAAEDGEEEVVDGSDLFKHATNCVGA